MWFGDVNIVQHILAREYRYEYCLRRLNKKRKNWRVVRVEFSKPGAYQIGNTIYMHPELYAKLEGITKEGS